MVMDDRQSMRRGRPIKYPRPPECPHLDRPEHANGVCYQCSSNINNQKKREKKMGDHMESPKIRRRLKDYDEDPNSTFVEINVGGKIFATTLNTLNKEVSLLSVLINGSLQNISRYDNQGRLFIDRDPTHFRWLLNYLRDGFLVTVPEKINDRMEILQEARFYSMTNLITIISNSHTVKKQCKNQLTINFNPPQEKSVSPDSNNSQLTPLTYPFKVSQTSTPQRTSVLQQSQPQSQPQHQHLLKLLQQNSLNHQNINHSNYTQNSQYKRIQHPEGRFQQSEIKKVKREQEIPYLMASAVGNGFFLSEVR